MQCWAVCPKTCAWGNETFPTLRYDQETSLKTTRVAGLREFKALTGASTSRAREVTRKG